MRAPQPDESAMRWNHQQEAFMKTHAKAALGCMLAAYLFSTALAKPVNYAQKDLVRT